MTWLTPEEMSAAMLRSARQRASETGSMPLQKARALLTPLVQNTQTTLDRAVNNDLDKKEVDQREQIRDIFAHALGRRLIGERRVVAYLDSVLGREFRKALVEDNPHNSQLPDGLADEAALVVAQLDVVRGNGADHAVGGYERLSGAASERRAELTAEIERLRDTWASGAGVDLSTQPGITADTASKSPSLA